MTNPLQLRGAALSKFLSQPGGLQRYEAAERAKKELGSVDGRHYTEYLPEAKRLMRAKDYGSAIPLLQRLVAAADAEVEFGGGHLPPWYRATLNKAIAMHKKN